ncbi:FtsX-like permease family protein, partial [bacterium]|nr:FtsX-like permease family protein [bacterium]
QELSDALRSFVQPQDLGLHLRKAERFSILESERIFLDDYATSLALAARSAPTKALRREPPMFWALAYLVNEIRTGRRSIPYSMALGSSALLVKDNEMLLNQWAADNLNARVGEPVALTYFVEGQGGFLREATTTLTLGRILPMSYPYVTNDLSPRFEGITDSASIGQWNPPFPLDLGRIRPVDEEYWEEYRAAPKAFVSLKTAQRLWGTRYGNITAALWPGENYERLESVIQTQIRPEEAGFRFRPIREENLEASRGSSDFGWLFVGFSLFLLIAAAMLLQILFRLGVEARGREYGLLEAVGFAPQQARRMMLTEGGLIAAGGALLGLPLALGYARMLIYGLNTWWVGSIGGAFLHFDASPLSVAVGMVGGWFICLLSIWAAARSLEKLPARALLAGQAQEDFSPGRQRGKALLFGAAFLILAIALLFLSRGKGVAGQASFFFGAGATLLASGLAFFRAWLSAKHEKRPENLSLVRLGILGARRRPGRSLLVAGLVATASFLIVAVGANRHVAGTHYGLDSGTGGFELLAESSVPFYRELSRIVPETPGIKDLAEKMEIQSLRLRPGQDASCLNLYQVRTPRVLGVSPAFIGRGGFDFAEAIEPGIENPWELLDRPLVGGVIPAIGDYTTVYWLLHRKLGDEITVGGARLRIVSLLRKSVFQSELLISEGNFKKAWPDAAGWSVFAIDAHDSPESASTALESAFEDHGLDVIAAPERLNDLMRVENTYLSTFQTLGGLGLLLGTIGLALALARNLIERRREFALLQSFGFRRSHLTILATAENGLLLGVGLLLGLLTGATAVAPSIHARAVEAPWVSLMGTLLLIFAGGLAVTALVAYFIFRAPLLPSLKRE